MKASPLIALAAAGLGAWAWVALHPSPERVIRRQLDGVARAASFAPGQGYLAQLADAKKLAGFFSTNVDVNIDVPGRHEHGFAGREEIQQAALAARASGRGLSVSFPDVTVMVNAGGESAVADAALEARIAGEQDLIVQEMKITLRKVGGRWLIVRVETVRTLSRPGFSRGITEPPTGQRLLLACRRFVGAASKNAFVSAAERTEPGFDALDQPKGQAALAAAGAPADRTVQANFGEDIVNHCFSTGCFSFHFARGGACSLSRKFAGNS